MAEAAAVGGLSRPRGPDIAPIVWRRPTTDAWLSGLLLYFLLGAYLFVVYVAVLAAGGVTDQTDSVPWWLNAISLPILILTARPVRVWLRKAVHGVVYGQHDNPYAFLTAMRDRLAADPTPRAMVPAIASMLAATLKLPFVAVETSLSDGRGPDDPPLAAAFGAPVDGAETYAIPLGYGHERLGTLHVSARRPGEPLSSDDLKLLEDLARQVGITLHAAHLTEALQASRRQIVTAREEERRRIRRDLHDGLGPTLASLRMQLSALRPALGGDAAAEALVDSLRDDVRAATADIRRLVYDLRPPMLDEFGLAGALRNLGAASAGGTPRTVDVPDALPPLPAAVEVALYRIAAEALHNVDRHANASACAIQLAVSPAALTLTVADDGAGFAAGAAAGVGLASMRERAAELGGTIDWTTAPGSGTIVTAVLPLRGTP